MDFLYEIQRREPVFQHPEWGTTQQDFENLTDPSFYGIDSYGRRYSREQAITTALVMYKDPGYKGLHSWPTETWEIGKFEWLGISHNKLLVTYMLLTRNQLTRRTSIWRIENNIWTIVFHQATPVQD
ncbi:MAG: hypothetical protein ACFB16_16760 [Phormidesmis sp.]